MLSKTQYWWNNHREIRLNLVLISFSSRVSRGRVLASRRRKTRSLDTISGILGHGIKAIASEHKGEGRKIGYGIQSRSEPCATAAWLELHCICLPSPRNSRRESSANSVQVYSPPGSRSIETSRDGHWLTLWFNYPHEERRNSIYDVLSNEINNRCIDDIAWNVWE